MQPSSPLHFMLALGLSATVFNVGVSTVTHLAATTPEEGHRTGRRRAGWEATSQVRVMSLETVVAGESGLQAQVDPAARLGQPTRFVLLGHGGVRRRLGRSNAAGRGAFARAVRAIARDEAITSDAFEIVNGASCRRWRCAVCPRLEKSSDCKARRVIARGEALTSRC
jgi:hypothetical protein